MHDYAARRETAVVARRYTHVLKTDDDCYVRFEALLRTLRPPPTPLIGLDGLPVMGAAAAAAAARSAEPVDSVRLEKVRRAPTTSSI